jgi:hypothetical protein
MTSRILLSSLFVFGFGFGSFYIFPSGNPQPSDFVILLWIIIVIILGTSKVSFNHSDKTFIAILSSLIFVIFSVSIFNAIYYGYTDIAYPTLFYIYNGLFVISYIISSKLYGDIWRKTTLNAVFFASICSLFFLIINFDTNAFRQTGGFNNPNQLGYYSLLLFCSMMVLAHRKEALGFKGITVFIVSLIGILSAASLSAIAALFLALIGFSLQYVNRNSIKYLYFSSFIIVIVFFCFVHYISLDSYLVSILDARFNLLDTKIENAEISRGYFRIFENPQHLIIGAGEGGLHRFESWCFIEIHSTPGTLLFSYGITGLILFLILYYFSIRKSSLTIFIIAAAPFTYSLFHHGLRSTTFWLFIVIMYLFRNQQNHDPLKRFTSKPYNTRII